MSDKRDCHREDEGVLLCNQQKHQMRSPTVGLVSHRLYPTPSHFITIGQNTELARIRSCNHTSLYELSLKHPVQLGPAQGDIYKAAYLSVLGFAFC